MNAFLFSLPKRTLTVLGDIGGSVKVYVFLSLLQVMVYMLGIYISLTFREAIPALICVYLALEPRRSFEPLHQETEWKVTRN